MRHASYGPPRRATRTAGPTSTGREEGAAACRGCRAPAAGLSPLRISPRQRRGHDAAVRARPAMARDICQLPCEPIGQGRRESRARRFAGGGLRRGGRGWAVAAVGFVRLPRPWPRCFRSCGLRFWRGRRGACAGGAPWSSPHTGPPPIKLGFTGPPPPRRGLPAHDLGNGPVAASTVHGGRVGSLSRPITRRT